MQSFSWNSEPLNKKPPEGPDATYFKPTKKLDHFLFIDQQCTALK